MTARLRAAAGSRASVVGTTEAWSRASAMGKTKAGAGVGKTEAGVEL